MDLNPCMIGAHDSGVDALSEVVSARLRAVRVASAARRALKGRDLSERDFRILESVRQDLEDEVGVLRKTQMVDVRDEGAFAFSSLALSAFRDVPHRQQSLEAADDLERLVLVLKDVLDERASNEDLSDLERIFRRAGQLSRSQTGSPGEEVTPIDDQAVMHAAC